MTALELLFKTKENPQATDDAMLLWLYEGWKSEEGQRLQHKLEKRDTERNTPRAIFSYDSSSFRYIYEEAANDNLEIANEEVFTHWFVEEDVTGRLLELLSVFDKDEVEKVKEYYTGLNGMPDKLSIKLYADKRAYASGTVFLQKMYMKEK